MSAPSKSNSSASKPAKPNARDCKEAAKPTCCKALDTFRTAAKLLRRFKQHTIGTSLALNATANVAKCVVENHAKPSLHTLKIIKGEFYTDVLTDAMVVDKSFDTAATFVDSACLMMEEALDSLTPHVCPPSPVLGGAPVYISLSSDDSDDAVDELVRYALGDDSGPPSLSNIKVEPRRHDTPSTWTSNVLATRRGGIAYPPVTPPRLAPRRKVLCPTSSPIPPLEKAAIEMSASPLSLSPKDISEEFIGGPDSPRSADETPSTSDLAALNDVSSPSSRDEPLPEAPVPDLGPRRTRASAGDVPLNAGLNNSPIETPPRRKLKRSRIPLVPPTPFHSLSSSDDDDDGPTSPNFSPTTPPKKKGKLSRPSPPLTTSPNFSLAYAMSFEAGFQRPRSPTPPFQRESILPDSGAETLSPSAKF